VDERCCQHGSGATYTDPAAASLKMGGMAAWATGRNLRIAQICSTSSAASAGSDTATGGYARIVTQYLDVPGEILCIAVRPDGTRFVCTASAVFAVSQRPDTTFTAWLCAGDPLETGFQDGEGTDARFNGPRGITVDGGGNMIIADTNNNVIRSCKITHALHHDDAAVYTVSTLAGPSPLGHAWVNQHAGFENGMCAEARFCSPWGIIVNAEGIVFISDRLNHCLRKLTPAGVVSTLADLGRKKGGFVDGEGSAARFNHPCGLALDIHGNIIVADAGNARIRRVTVDKGIVTSVAGCGEYPRRCADGEAATACFNNPQSIAVDGHNNIYVADTLNHRIRVISGADSRVSTLAGCPEAGCRDGTGAAALLNLPWSLAIDECGRVLVAEQNHACVRIVYTDLPWNMARILYIGLLKSDYLHAASSRREGEGVVEGLAGTCAGGQCVFGLLPVEGGKGLVCPILTRIIEMLAPKLI